MEPAKCLRRMGGVFQRLPRALQKMPVLRVHDGCVARAEAEERCVEERHAIEDRGAAHVVGIGEIFGRCAGGEQFRFGKVADGLDAVAQVLPELGGRARAGKTPRHADNRDGGGLHGAVVSRCRAILRRAARSESWLAAVLPARPPEMRGERADRGELEEIEQCNLAAQRLLQFGVRLGHGEGVRAEIEEVVVQAD